MSRLFVCRRARSNKTLWVFIQCERSHVGLFCSQGPGMEGKTSSAYFWLRARWRHSPKRKVTWREITGHRWEGRVMFCMSPSTWFLNPANQHVLSFSHRDKAWRSYAPPLCWYPNTSFSLDCLRPAIPPTTRVTLLNVGSFLHMVLLNTSSRRTMKSLMATWLFSAHISHSAPRQVSLSGNLPEGTPLLSSFLLTFLLLSFPLFVVNFSSFPTFFCSLCFSHFVLFYFLK